MDFLGIGAPELLLVFIVALIILGPDRLPEAMAKVGKIYREFRAASQGITDQISRELQIEEWQRKAREFEAESRKATQFTLPNPLETRPQTGDAPPAAPEFPVRSEDAFGPPSGTPPATSPAADAVATDPDAAPDVKPAGPPGSVPRSKATSPEPSEGGSRVHLGPATDTPQ